jgi:type I restriction enzyme S subunit
MTLKEAGVILIDCLHQTPAATEVGYPYITIPEMKNGRIDFEAARRISHADYVLWTKKARPQLYDVVLSRRTNPGVIATFGNNCEFALGQNLVLLRADGRHVCPEFLRWLAASPAWWTQIEKYINVGAVFDSLRCADVPRFELPIPSKSEQRAIASILDALDDKIDLNSRMNGTLEAMARAIFKDWFVDFSPTRAKMEGGAPYLAPEIWALFPDRLDDDGKPESWKHGRLDDLLVLQRGFDLPSDTRQPGKIVVMAASGPNGLHSEFKVRGPGVVTGRSGVLGRVFFVMEDFWPLNTSLWIKEFKGSSPLHAYFLLQTLDFGSFNAGSAVPTLNRNHVHSLPMPVPPRALVAAFDSYCVPFMQLRRANDIQSETLATTRDLLLPKLMSGEIRVKDAENVAEAAA